MDSDQELVQRVINGDRHAADQFVENRKEFIWRMVCKSCGKQRWEDDAISIFSDVFLRLFDHNFRALRQWRGEGILEAYLAMIVRNCAKDHFRRRRDAPEGYTGVSLTRFDDDEGSELEVAGDEPDPAELLMRNWRESSLRDAVQDSIRQLSERDGELIKRRHYDDQSYKEIAAGMKLTVNAVGVYLLRAEKRLMVILKRDHAAALDME